jgi:hypothetical protein
MTRMGELSSEEGIPTLHLWTGDDAIPVLQPLEVPELALAGKNPMPPVVIKQRSKGIRTNKLATPGWKIVTNDVAVVRGNVDPVGLKATAVYAQELFVMLQSYLGGGKEDFTGRFSVRLFREHPEYRHYAARAGAANAESFYDPRSSEIVHWFDRFPTQDLFQRSFAHEFNHAYVDRLFKRTDPLWFMEGMAEWFSNIEWRAGIFVPGQMNSHALFILQQSSDANALSIEKLISLTRDDMYGMNFASYYAQAWSLVDYIMTEMPRGTLTEMLQGNYPNLPSHQEAWVEHVHRMLS